MTANHERLPEELSSTRLCRGQTFKAVGPGMMAMPLTPSITQEAEAGFYGDVVQSVVIT